MYSHRPQPDHVSRGAEGTRRGEFGDGSRHSVIRKKEELHLWEGKGEQTACRLPVQREGMRAERAP